jgi:hypothetical protein
MVPALRQAGVNAIGEYSSTLAKDNHENYHGQVVI